MSGNHSYIELMIICPASGCGYFIGDQDYDANWLRCTRLLGSCASSIKDASTQLARHEESACASTRGPAALYQATGELRLYLTRPPDIVYGCEAYAGSRVLIIGTRGVSTAMGNDALAGSLPVRRPELSIDGGLLLLRWEQVIVSTTGHDGQHYGATLLLPQVANHHRRLHRQSPLALLRTGAGHRVGIQNLPAGGPPPRSPIDAAATYVSRRFERVCLHDKLLQTAHSARGLSLLCACSCK